MTKRVLVLGGSGFLGKRICRVLEHADGFQVYNGDLNNGGNTETKFIRVDLLDLEQIVGTIKDFDIIINCVGQVTNPFNLCLDLNTVGITNLADALRPGKHHLIQISTLAVFGTLDSCSETSPLNPETNYATAKCFAEWILKKAIPSERLTILRLPNLYGPGQEKGVVAYILRSFRNDRILEFNNNGDLRRTYLHSADCANIITCFSRNLNHSGSYNIIGPESYSIRELIDMVVEKTGVDFKTIYQDLPPWENISKFDDTKFRKVIHFQSGNSLRSFITNEIGKYKIG